MTIRYNVQADEEALAEVKALFEFLGGNMRRAQQVAINKTGKKIKTLSGKRIRDQVRLPAKYVNDRLKFFRASNSNLSAKISTPSRGLLLSRFSTKPEIAGFKQTLIKAPPVPDRGIRIKIKPDGPVKVVSGGNEIEGKPFYMKLPNGPIAIAGRRKVAGKRGGKIKVFYGPSLSQVFGGPRGVKQSVLPDAGKEFTEQMADAIRFLLAKKAAKE